jgi:hypothetical protein
MAVATIRSRLERLEASVPKHKAKPKLWVCHVRQGQEGTDRTAAFARTDEQPADGDIVIQAVHHRPGTWETKGEHVAKPL